ncbi:FKBP-type peptidyl-prolyl cis-trans isomerase [Sanguibacter suaedae]|uniref:Peptidyl-prolyl cis-trans isomerase n=1 Tax=Sanguibacter suaedae TaxID=2795737 RepID=A0A934IE57_9MICO|nr:FKBP-type peptidyl-prolyl cis-trans isomerase [Sanguibacter suaedae]MBI9116085.1 FKBP-type peptidyl-prolyl cis-trans isomerase [Sanguibacter suaedae]
MTALTLGAALLLTACGDDSDDATATPSATDAASTAPEATAEDVAALEAVTYDGEVGSKPTIGLTPPFEVTGVVARVASEGTGEVPEGDEVWVHVLQVDGSTGDELGTSWEGTPEVLDLSMAPEGDPLAEVLRGAPIGSQLLFAAPDQAGGERSIITAMEVVEPLPAITPDAGMPTVTFDEAGKPSIELTPGYAGPEDLVVQVLEEGDGAVVESGQTVSVNYTGWLQSNGEQFDSSWDRGTPFDTVIGERAVIAGWDEGIVGQKVGSKLLLVIPSDLAYGDAGQSSIPGGATLVFVVEILEAS